MSKLTLPKPLVLVLSGAGALLAAILGGLIGFALLRLMNLHFLVPLDQLMKGADPASMPFLYVKLFALAAVMVLFLGWITTRKTDSRLGGEADAS